MNEDFEKETLKYFEQISAIPRVSENEEGISQYLLEFAKQNGLACLRQTDFEKDLQQNEGMYNVVIRKNATDEKFKNSSPVILQAHMDMVGAPEGYDFKKTPPFKLVVHNNLITAVGTDWDGKEIPTSLGADDGIGVACILTILANREIVHPDLIAVFTVCEEKGLHGARNLSKSMIEEITKGLEMKDARLINIDEEKYGQFCMGCAGGVRAELIIEPEYQGIKKEDCSFYEISIKGLCGGHSGIEIDKKRAHANILIGRILEHLKDAGIQNLRLVSIKGGNAENAISSSANCVIAFSSSVYETVLKEFEVMKCIIFNEYNHKNNDRNKWIEPNMEISLQSHDQTYDKVFSESVLQKVIAILILVPNGVLFMDNNIEGLVETSSNLGIIQQNEITNELCFISAIRSSVDTRKEFVRRQFKYIAQSLGIKAGFRDDYPGWTADPDSRLAAVFKSSYKTIQKEEADFKCVHAGLECGLLLNTFGEIDMIACGPTITDVHDVKETLYKDTVPKIMSLLVHVLNHLD